MQAFLAPLALNPHVSVVLFVSVQLDPLFDVNALLFGLALLTDSFSVFHDTFAA